MKSLFDPEMLPEPFDYPPAQRHSPTSVAAAESIEPVAGTLRARVLHYLRCAGESGLTDEQMQLGLEMNASTQRPRRIELVGGGLVADSGRVRDTVSGRKAVVWVAVDVKQTGAAT